MNQPVTDLSPTIMDLPSIVLRLYERVQQPLQENGQPANLFVRYLRRKAERGLAVIYAVDAQHTRRTEQHRPQRTVSLTLDEQALDGAHIRFSQSAIEQVPLTLLPSGVLAAPPLGLSVQAFPADSHLPALAASCDTSPQGPLFNVLQEMARIQLQDQRWNLQSASAEPVRYKPANRCVIRYRLNLHHAEQDEERALTIFGKVYANPAQAQAVQQLQQQLYAEQQDTQPFLPRPLGIIEATGLTFNEAVEAPSATADTNNADRWAVLRTGMRALTPAFTRGPGGQILETLIPKEELWLTGQALARLHTSAITLPPGTLRTGAKEAKRALERAALIAGRYSAQAVEVQQLARRLASRLSSLQPSEYRPAHGGFKASQLLFHSHRVFVVDFDGLCLADPALDVGYFLAYLRPSGLWYHRQGTRAWFEAAAETFRQSYREAMLAHGISSNTIDATLARARDYEAALLFKIATRRVNRLNSPRPQELVAMLNEIASCLSDPAERENS
jgi:hypothetical protein